ncbi:hypothetical protein HYG93_07210 [Acinetobacter sp. SwsAc6]|uniref:hypothetical protein n=1 Tax=Acinetobacter sp. SwsAc6 TaxID=2749439 RepID=UPI0015B7BC3C|nr:hypothetical protein [Acinetobacter sp. SwsAc6]NWK74077.1 hypothetical protein [Acinetobacter sp. SwsAc6]
MTNLISGKEALIALANGEEVELQVVGDMNWHDSTQWTVGELLCFTGKFRLKPRTITINGIEVPAPFEPKDGDKFFYLNDGEEVGYIVCTHDWGFDPSELNFGAWRSEDEIKQVVAALRQVFGLSDDAVNAVRGGK